MIQRFLFRTIKYKLNAYIIMPTSDFFRGCQVDPSGRRFRFQQIDKQFTRQSRFLIVWFRLRMLSDLLLEGRSTYRPTEDKIRTVCAKFDHFSGRNAIFVVVG